MHQSSPPMSKISLALSCITAEATAESELAKRMCSLKRPREVSEASAWPFKTAMTALRCARNEARELANCIDILNNDGALQLVHVQRQMQTSTIDRLELGAAAELRKAQLREAGAILRCGAKTMASTIRRQRDFEADLVQLRKRWRICAPAHPVQPSALHVEEPLAVDCSFDSVSKHIRLTRHPRNGVEIAPPPQELSLTLRVTVLRRDVALATTHSVAPVEVEEKEEAGKVPRQYPGERQLHECLHQTYCAALLRRVQIDALAEGDLGSGREAGATARPHRLALLSLDNSRVAVAIDADHSLEIRLVNASSSSPTSDAEWQVITDAACISLETTDCSLHAVISDLREAITKITGNA